jgi:Mg2+/Co2+ transporter CorB
LAVIILAPIVSMVKFVVWRMLNLFGIRQDGEVPVLTAHEEIRGAIELHHQEGAVETEHRHMLGGILDLSELKVSDVMVHRKNMVTIDVNANLDDTLETILNSAHTRLPVWEGDPENIIAVLHIKDLIRHLTKSRGSLEEIDLKSLALVPWFVPETTTLKEQINAFRDRHAHFALVVDEYGTIEGLITLEDILEEIFGNIAEQFDDDLPPGIRPQPDGSYNIDGWTPIREINRELDWDLPDDDATTIAGLVINEAQMIPDLGQKFSFHGFTFRVLRKKRNQITAIRVAPPPELTNRPIPKSRH